MLVLFSHQLRTFLRPLTSPMFPFETFPSQFHCGQRVITINSMWFNRIDCQIDSVMASPRIVRSVLLLLAVLVVHVFCSTKPKTFKACSKESATNLTGVLLRTYLCNTAEDSSYFQVVAFDLRSRSALKASPKIKLRNVTLIVGGMDRDTGRYFALASEDLSHSANELYIFDYRSNDKGILTESCKLSQTVDRFVGFDGIAFDAKKNVLLGRRISRTVLDFHRHVRSNCATHT